MASIGLAELIVVTLIGLAMLAVPVAAVIGVVMMMQKKDGPGP
jgi:hypothetical protein